ncbi:MAG: pro-sigmaK processing inhibitor BofA family protein [Oscillospiraceae bacterium]|nr:pro-sigmaK processing inhibitor BofA family protein [Oscillospiraceae bacterium]
MFNIIAAAVLTAAVLFYIIRKISPRLFVFMLNLSANTVISFAALTVYNLAAAHFGIVAGINVFSVLLCALGGIPGFAAFVLLTVLLK